MIAQLLHKPTPSTTFARVLKHVGLPLGGVHWLGLRFRPPPSRTASVEPSSPSRGCEGALPAVQVPGVPPGFDETASPALTHSSPGFNG